MKSRAKDMVIVGDGKGELEAQSSKLKGMKHFEL
jgi:hypothetical protein